MNKIKIVGVLIVIISISLAILFDYINTKNNINNNLLDTINKQKAFTQEISKNIFYIYKNKHLSTKQLDDSIKEFLEKMNNREDILNEISSSLIKKQSSKILALWNKFYLEVQKFREQNKVTMAYSNIILEKTVKNIYNINLSLIVEFDKLISLHQSYSKEKLQRYRFIQYILFIILSGLLIYLFTQVRVIIAFIQKFSKTSKEVIENSTIKELKPIEIENSNTDIKNATNNFNFLVQKINRSIQYSYKSIEHTSQSLKQIENSIEEFLVLLNTMDENKDIDIQMTKKEDAVIQSLEELMNVTAALDNLQSDLENLYQPKTKLKN